MRYLRFHSGLIAALLLAACSPQVTAARQGGSGGDAAAVDAVGGGGGGARDAGAAGADDDGGADDDDAAMGVGDDDGGADDDGAAAGGDDGGDGPESPWKASLMVVAVGNDGRRMVSADETNWTGDVRDTMGNTEGSKELKAVAYGNHVVVAVGGGCSPDCVPRVLTFDGRAWTEAALPAGQGRLTAVAYGVVAGQGRWVAVGDAGTVLRSADDGRTWTAGDGRVPNGVRAIAFGKVGAADMFIVAGDGYVRARSPDGNAWTDVQGPTTSSEGYRAVAVGGGVAVAVGTGRSNTGVRTRTVDGVTWTDEQMASPDLLNVVYTDDRFMAFSGTGDSTAFVSPLGLHDTWVEQPTVNAGSNIAVGRLAAVGRLFVSRVSPSSIRISADGLSWVARTQSRQGDSQINAFVFAGY